MTADPKQPLNICLVTDVFPPAGGGSGWSTYYLGKALQERGHHVDILRPVYGKEAKQAEYKGLPVYEVEVPSPPPLLNRLKLGKAWQETKAVNALAQQAHQFTLSGTHVLHAQHMLSTLAVHAARRKERRVVTVATVRDYWPLCPASTRLFPDHTGRPVECVNCHKLPRYLRCTVRGVSPLSRAKALARWERTTLSARALAACDTTIAVSRYVRSELARGGRVPPHKLVTIPNLVHLASVERALNGAWPLPDITPDEPFFLFAGKLDYNKGAHLLPQAIAANTTKLPLVIAGEGPMRSRIETEAHELGLDFRFYNWLDNNSVLLLMKHARALLFPSAWAEPLSRVLLEGCAAGAAVVALNTGGTGDIITHMKSGWLAQNITDFSKGISEVSGNPTLNSSLRMGAAQRAREHFASERVSAQVEALYYTLLEAQKA